MPGAEKNEFFPSNLGHFPGHLTNSANLVCAQPAAAMWLKQRISALFVGCELFLDKKRNAKEGRKIKELKLGATCVI
jgi:hypothetical protein